MGPAHEALAEKQPAERDGDSGGKIPRPNSSRPASPGDAQELAAFGLDELVDPALRMESPAFSWSPVGFDKGSNLAGPGPLDINGQLENRSVWPLESDYLVSSYLPYLASQFSLLRRLHLLPSHSSRLKTQTQDGY